MSRLLVVAFFLAAGLLASPRAAGGQEPPLPDAIPTWWHEAAGLTPLLTAPPPPNPATICVIDTGVTPTPDLDITARWAYDGGTLDDVHATADSPGHGTLVAHFAAGAVNGWGGAGAFPHGRISSVRVFPREGGASWREYIAAISRCLKLDANTKVIVISIGGQEIEPGEAEELEHHIERARDRYNVSVVVAAGNGGGRVDFPGRFGAAFTTAAADRTGKLCPFSASGPEVDIVAPGCGTLQSGWDGIAWSVSGTSFAAPIVAGALAAVRAFAPSLTAREAELVLTSSGRPGSPPSLDAAAALVEAGVAIPSEESPPDRQPAQDVRTLDGTPAVPGVGTPGRRLVRPRVTVRRRARSVLVVARNRPVAVAFEVRVGHVIVRRRSSRIRVTSSRGRARCRFVDDGRASAWTRVQW